MTSLSSMLAVTRDEDRERERERPLDHRRAPVERRVDRPSPVARLHAALLRLAPRTRAAHAVTDYPCRLANGEIGRVAVIETNGEWTLVCRVA
jgi:hypothetical protein